MSLGRASSMARPMALRRSTSTRYFVARFLEADQASLMMAQRIFAARIVGGEDDEVAVASGRFAHERAGGAVAISAATEEEKTRGHPPPRATNSRAGAVRVADGHRRRGRNPRRPRRAGRTTRSNRPGLGERAAIPPAMDSALQPRAKQAADAARMLYTLGVRSAEKTARFFPSGVIRSKRVPRGATSTFSVRKSPRSQP